MSTEKDIVTVTGTVIAYSIGDKEIEELKKEFEEIPVCDTPEKYDVVKKAISRLTKLRVGIESERSIKKKPVLALGKEIDALAKKITNELRPIEDALRASKKIPDDIAEQQVRDAEIAESQRIGRLVRAVEEIKAFMPTEYLNSSEYYDTKLLELYEIEITEDTFEEYFPQALTVREVAGKALTDLSKGAKAREDAEVKQKELQEQQNEALSKEKQELENSKNEFEREQQEQREADEIARQQEAEAFDKDKQELEELRKEKALNEQKAKVTALNKAVRADIIEALSEIVTSNKALAIYTAIKKGQIPFVTLSDEKVQTFIEKN